MQADGRVGKRGPAAAARRPRHSPISEKFLSNVFLMTFFKIISKMSIKIKNGTYCDYSQRRQRSY